LNIIEQKNKTRKLLHYCCCSTHCYCSVDAEIVDPNATKPETWDGRFGVVLKKYSFLLIVVIIVEEMDGEWTAPTIANPAAEGKNKIVKNNRVEV
jgi:hypothetical protein